MNKNFSVFVDIGDSERLTYKQLSGDDYEFFKRLFSDEQVMRYAYEDCFESEQEAVDGFQQWFQSIEDETVGDKFIVFTKDNEGPIGMVYYFIETLHQNGGVYEVGYHILPEYWGKGYTNEMCSTLISYLLNNYNIHKISASCHIDDKRSEVIMDKLGMTKEGVIRKGRYKDRHWVDEVKYGLLKEEWTCKHC